MKISCKGGNKDTADLTVKTSCIGVEYKVNVIIENVFSYSSSIRDEVQEPWEGDRAEVSGVTRGTKRFRDDEEETLLRDLKKLKIEKTEGTEDRNEEEENKYTGGNTIRDQGEGHPQEDVR